MKKSIVMIVFVASAVVLSGNLYGAKKAYSVSQGATDKSGKVHTLEGSPFVCENVVAVEGQEASLLPKGKKFKLIWNDEFNGNKLDDSKWGYRTNFWGRKAHWFATPEDKAIEVKDGLLRMKLLKRSDGQFISP